MSDSRPIYKLSRHVKNVSLTQVMVTTDSTMQTTHLLSLM